MTGHFCHVAFVHRKKEFYFQDQNRAPEKALLSTKTKISRLHLRCSVAPIFSQNRALQWPGVWQTAVLGPGFQLLVHSRPTSLNLEGLGSFPPWDQESTEWRPSAANWVKITPNHASPTTQHTLYSYTTTAPSQNTMNHESYNYKFSLLKPNQIDQRSIGQKSKIFHCALKSKNSHAVLLKCIESGTFCTTQLKRNEFSRFCLN